ncbi:phospholipase [Devosia pacifica]|uniref:Phospholipase n=1 Tax=Devosia pacifica TaxID=1335967 RepID=A0A918VV68_9HYPH|nr:prolyl oligopeptidase family serine peptidase [Devosia pacifica]GHA26125.1 phospholipase [Devosia pacifica]
MTTTLSGPMVPPKSGTARQAVVLLHGYGADGQDLLGLAPALQPAMPDALFVAPNAPQQCDQLSAGYQWFPISFEGDRLSRRQKGVLEARPVLEGFLEALWAQTGLNASQTVLIGFSQGAMMALHVGMALDKPPRAIIGFSGAFLPPAGFGEARTDYPPVCLVHGDSDSVVDPALSAEAKDALEAAGVAVHYHVSPGAGHGIAPDGLESALDFLSGLQPA